MLAQTIFLFFLNLSNAVLIVPQFFSPSYIKFSSLIEKISAKLNNNSQIYKQTKKLKDTCPNKKLKDTCPNKEQEDIYQDKENFI
jgi:hypothetical protein